MDSVCLLQKIYWKAYEEYIRNTSTYSGEVEETCGLPKAIVVSILQHSLFTNFNTIPVAFLSNSATRLSPALWESVLWHDNINCSKSHDMVFFFILDRFPKLFIHICKHGFAHVKCIVQFFITCKVFYV